MNVLCRCVLAGFLLIFPLGRLLAQDAAATVLLPAAAPVPETEEEILKQEQSQRLLGVVPMFSVTNRQNAPALTSRQKLRLFEKSAFDPFEYAAAGLQAGISQDKDEFNGYGQGAAAYGKRYGASLADEVSGSFFTSYVYASAFKEDPRYFRLGDGTFKHRLLHALEQVVICRKDDGTHGFNWANLLGSFSSGGLSNLYYPGTDRGLDLTLSRSAIAMVNGAPGALIEEFWPDIRRKVFRRK